MLFVNLSDTSTSTYANTFPEKGRKLVWFPGTGQTKQHPLIRRMLNICQVVLPHQPLKLNDRAPHGCSKFQYTDRCMQQASLIVVI